MQIHSPKRAGFSIVEVALALAIASVVLLAIFAMVYVSQQSTKASSDDTRLSQISQQVFRQVQIDLASNAAFTAPPTSTWTQNGTSYSRQYWFDAQGSSFTSNPTSAPASAFYQATVTLGVIVNPATGLPGTYPPNVDSTILKSLVITIAWPPIGTSPPTWSTITTAGSTRTYSMVIRNRGSYGNSTVDTPPYPP